MRAGLGYLSAALQVIGQGVEPGGIFGLQGERFGGGGPALGTVATVCRAVRANREWARGGVDFVI